MAKFTITAPDGQRYDVNAPDGATEADAISYVQKNLYKAKADTTDYSPTNGMSGFDKFAAGMGKSMYDTARGAGQYLGLVDSKDVDESKARDAALMRTGAGTAGNISGQIAQFIPAAMASGGTLPAAIGLGALQGALTPTGQGDSTLKNIAIGGGLGAAGPLVARGAGAAFHGAKGLAEPFMQGGRERIAGRVLDRFAVDPANIRSAASVPTPTGARPTLAESTKDTGLAALQRATESLDPQLAGQFAQRAADNNAARIGVLQGIAGDESTRAAAVASRQAASADMYKAATGATYTVDDKLASILQRPLVKQAMARAETMAENQGRPFAFNVTPPSPFSGVGVQGPAATRQITGQGLQDLKMAMDEMLSDPASGFAGKAGDVVKSTRRQIVDWMDEVNPAFKAARQTYAETSKPINQMDVGSRLLDKTTAAMRDLQGNQKLQANAFSRALNDEQGLVRKATGFRGVNALDDVMTPAQMRQINAVRGESELVANLAQAANGAGSQTAKSLASQNLMRQIIGPTGLPQSWADSVLLTNVARPLQFAFGTAEPAIQQVLAKGLLDPDYAKELIKAAAKKPGNKALLDGVGLLGDVGQTALPATGLLAAQR